MGQIYIFFNHPNFAVNDTFFLHPGSVWDQAQKQEKIPVGRAECIARITDSFFTDNPKIPWQAWNFTNPCLPDESMSRIARVLRYRKIPETLEKNIAIPIGSTTIAYGEPNGAGTLTSTLHPDSYFPGVGDVVTVMWDDAEDEKTTEKKAQTVVSGEQIFYGRITKVQQTAAGIQITAVDAIGVLLDSGQFSVGKMDALTAITQIAAHAGAYIYLSDSTFSAVIHLPTTPVTRVYTGTYLSGITDLLDRWYLETGRRHFIVAQGGLIEICDFDHLDEIDVIDARMIGAWTYEQDTEHVYTRVYIEYTVTDADGKTKKFSYRALDKNMLFRHSRYHTFRYTAESAKDAVTMANTVLKNHSRPEYKIEMTDVVGIPHLRPGMNVAIPIRLYRDGANNEVVAVSRIRSITHKFSETSYTMDLVVDCFPYRTMADPAYSWVDRIGVYSGMTSIYEDPPEWISGITVVYFDPGQHKEVRIRNEQMLASTTASTQKSDTWLQGLLTPPKQEQKND